jgi:hypothetical protein
MTPRLGLYMLPPGIAALWSITVLISALLALVVFLVVIYSSQLTAGWQMGLLVLQMVMLMPLPWIAAHNLAQSRRVLMSRAAPLTVWRGEVRAVCWTLFMAWLMTSLCAFGLTLMVSETTAQLAETASNCGLAALLMVLFTAAFASQMWSSRSIWIAAALPTLCFFVMRAMGYRVSDLREVPLVVLGLGATLLMLSLFYMNNRTVRTWRNDPERSSQLTSLWRTRLAGWFRRPYIDADQRQFALIPVILFAQLPMHLEGTGLLFSFWGDGINAWNLIRVLCLTAVAQGFVSSGDLHVRNLLAPGGVFRSRLGQRVFASTLVSVALFTTALLLVFFLAIQVLSMWFAEAKFQLSFSNTVPIACEVLMAVSLATLLRGYAAANRMLVASLFSVSLIATITALWATGLLTFQRHPPSFGTVGPTYIVGLLSLAALFTAASNRVWARADLAGLYRKQKRPDALPDNGW